jgi:hypothetical protein
MEYDAAVAAYLMRMAEWNALPAEGRGAAPVQPAAMFPVAKILFWDPLGQLSELFGRLYPERSSSSRIEEYRDFIPFPRESIPHMVNRLDLLHMQIGGPELQAVTKLLDALRKDMRTEVQQKLSARFAHTDAWTVRRAGEIAGEIERMPRSCLCTLGSPQGLGGVTTMLRVNPAVPLQPVATRAGLVISVARWAMSRGHALI